MSPRTARSCSCSHAWFIAAYKDNFIQKDRQQTVNKTSSKNLAFLILDLLQQLFHGDGPRCAHQKNHLTPVNWKLHRKTNLFPILTARLFRPICLHSTSLPCLLWHSNAWLPPEFPNSPMAPWGNGQGWLEAILPQHSGGQGGPWATLSSWAVSPCLTCLVENTWQLKIARWTCPLWF